MTLRSTFPASFSSFLILKITTVMENPSSKAIIHRILKDIQVELGDEFDKNFERQAFFSEAWARRKSPTRPGGHILVDTGQLRRSITSRVTDHSVIFSTSLPYAAIHNEGGDIVVTAKMKRFFWAKYYATSGAFVRKKNGEKRKTKKNAQLTTEAEFWKCLALMKVGKKIKIPRRQFLGISPEVEKSVREIIEDDITEYFEHDYNLNIK